MFFPRIGSSFCTSKYRPEGLCSGIEQTFGCIIYATVFRYTNQEDLMAFVPVPQTVKVAVKQAYFGQEVFNVLHFQTVASYTLTDLDELGGTAVAAYDTYLKPYMGEHWQIIGATATDISKQDGESFTQPDAPTDYGSLTNGPLPNNAAACVTLHTDKRGRSYRGRIYVPVTDASLITELGLLDSTWATHVLTLVAHLMTLPTTLPFLLSVVSYYLNKEKRTAGVATLVEAASMDNLFDSQRRRLIGRGA
jgi:hypothetical protein